jgi:hypothetical protein
MWAQQSIHGGTERGRVKPFSVAFVKAVKRLQGPIVAEVASLRESLRAIVATSKPVESCPRGCPYMRSGELE